MFRGSSDDFCILIFILQEALGRLMGRENFERYGGPIWQLKFCESFKVN